jgi:hypothetical protein
VYERLVRQLKTRFGAQPSAETEALARALRTALAAPKVIVPPATRPVPVTVLRPPRMIGRQREMGALQAALAERRVGLLLGEPGLGKTRLFGELAASLSRPAIVQGRPGDAGVPYATLVRLLRQILTVAPEAMADETPGDASSGNGPTSLIPKPRHALARLLPELAPGVPLPTDGQRVMLQGAVEYVLARGRVDSVLVDDLHFADEASCEMLQALIGSAALPSVHWVLAQRPGEGSAAASRLRDALEEAHLLQAVALAPLTEEEMAELVDSLGLPELDGRALAPMLVRHTGGNPLYALETLKLGLQQGMLAGTSAQRLPQPTSIGALIERRLKQLPERALALARVAAIAGVDFSIPLAEEVMGVRAVDLADAWSELEAAQVLRDSAFAHDLVYDAVLRSIPTPIARHLHGAVARWLDARGGEAGRIARHFIHAMQPARAAPHLLQAALQARAAVRNLEAAAMLEELADLQRAAGDVTAELAALEELRLALSYLDDAPRKQAVLLRIRACADTDARRAQAELALTRQLFEERQLEKAGEHAEAALRYAVDAGDADLVGRARLELALVLSESSRPAEAHAQLDRAHDWALASADADHRFSYHHTRAWASMAGEDFPRTIAAFEACLRMPELRADRAQYPSVLGNMAVVLARQGAMARALEYDEQRRACLEPEAVGGSTQNYLELNAALLLGFAGRFAEALAYFERAEQRAVPDQRMLHARWAHFWLLLGQHARALRHADKALAVASGHPLVRLAALVTRLQTQRAQGGAVPQAAQALTEIDAIAESEGSRAGAVRRLLAHAEFGPLVGARGQCEQALQLASASGLQGLALAALTLQCEAAVALGEPAAAAAAAERADTLRREFACDLTPRTRIVLALARVFAPQQRDRAEDLVRAEAGWLLETASRGVPAAFGDAFRARNPHHRAVLEWSSRTVLTGSVPAVSTAAIRRG